MVPWVRSVEQSYGRFPGGQRQLGVPHLAVDPDSRRLEILNDLVRAHIGRAPAAVDDDDDGPMLIIDDRHVTWRQLGQMLEAYEGWDLRLEIVDATPV